MVATMPTGFTVTLTRLNQNPEQAATSLTARLLAAGAGVDLASIALFSDRISAQAALDVMARELALGVSAASASAAAAADRADADALKAFKLAVSACGSLSPQALAARNHYAATNAAATKAAAATAEAWIDFTRAASAAEASTLDASKAAGAPATLSYESAQRPVAYAAASAWSLARSGAVQQLAGITG